MATISYHQNLLLCKTNILLFPIISHLIHQVPSNPSTPATKCVEPKGGRTREHKESGQFQVFLITSVMATLMAMAIMTTTTIRKHLFLFLGVEPKSPLFPGRADAPAMGWLLKASLLSSKGSMRRRRPRKWSTCTR